MLSSLYLHFNIKILAKIAKTAKITSIILEALGRCGLRNMYVYATKRYKNLKELIGNNKIEGSKVKNITA